MSNGTRAPVLLRMNVLLNENEGLPLAIRSEHGKIVPVLDYKVFIAIVAHEFQLDLVLLNIRYLQ